MDRNEGERLTREYTNACVQKRKFVEDYIKKSDIDCKKCEREECTFIKPPHYCNVKLIILDEELPVSINKLEKRFVTIDEALGFEENPDRRKE